jgi:hypothetical protein
LEQRREFEHGSHVSLLDLRGRAWAWAWAREQLFGACVENILFTVIIVIMTDFVYTGPGGESPPQNVVRVRVDPSVALIPAKAFYGRTKLTEVELCEGVVEIGSESFRWCEHSITKFNTPNSLRRIRNEAFSHSLRCPIHFHDGIESIGDAAFAHCIFTNFRVPPLITVIPDEMLWNCKSLFSLELSEKVMEIRALAFYNSYCIRNVVFPANVVFDGDNTFNGHITTDLYQLFGSNASIIWELQHRFDGLPIHRLVYYQSYNQGVLQKLIAVTNMRSYQSQTLRSKLDPTGNQQDCLGMTPLHILACSSVHDLEVYRVIVENYPTNLITEDRWGATPLLYAFWGAAPAEIIQFLLESYQSLYPDHVFNWTLMVETMGRTDTPKERIENLLCLKQMHFPEQSIDWEYLLNKFARPSRFSCSGAPFQERMQSHFMCGLSARMEALAFKLWRDHIENMILTADYKWNTDNSVILRGIREKLAHLERELTKIKEATTIIELALWKTRLDENGHKRETTRRLKKVKPDVSDIRQQCRVTCGADIIIRLVLPFLITAL